MKSIRVNQITAPEQAVFGPVGAAQFANCSTNKIYQAVRTRALIARKLGRRTIILRDDLLNWLNALPLKTEPSDVHRTRALERWAAHRSQNSVQE